MNICVLEDDRDFALTLEKTIRQYTTFPTAINTASASELLEKASKLAEPALYFLDIILANKSTGFDVARHIAESSDSNLIVFMTAYPQRIVTNAFYKTKAFNVILKSNPSLYQEIEETITLAKQTLKGKCLFVHIDKFQTLYIPYDDIYYIEAEKGTNKLCVHSENGRNIIRGTLKELQKQLEPIGFARCHKSILVNKANIIRQDKSTKMLIFRNGVSCPYSYLMRKNLI